MACKRGPCLPGGGRQSEWLIDVSGPGDATRQHRDRHLYCNDELSTAEIHEQKCACRAGMGARRSRQMRLVEQFVQARLSSWWISKLGASCAASSVPCAVLACWLLRECRARGSAFGRSFASSATTAQSLHSTPRCPGNHLPRGAAGCWDAAQRGSSHLESSGSTG